MIRSEMLDALRILGQRCEREAEIVLVGGGAAILCGWIERATADLDVVFADPALAALRAQVAAVAEELGLPERWINDGAKGFADVLPPDFRDRVVEVGTFGRLRVRTVGRPDFVLLKLFAMRATDIGDLAELKPSPEEIAFVAAQLPRIARFDPRRAHLIELYLEQGSAT